MIIDKTGTERAEDFRDRVMSTILYPSISCSLGHAIVDNIPDKWIDELPVAVAKLHTAVTDETEEETKRYHLRQLLYSFVTAGMQGAYDSLQAK